EALGMKLDDIVTNLDLGIAVIDLTLSDLTVTNMHVESVVALCLPESQSLEVDLGDTDMALSFSWAFKQEGWPYVSDHGTGTASVEGIMGSVIGELGYDHDCGVGQLTSGSVDFDFGDIDISLQGGGSALFGDILNMLVGLLEDLFSDTLNQIIADSLLENINSNLQQTAIQYIADNMSE
ncbi:hypothetical protein KIPB_013579, partial [Kipferlia bialata]